MKRWPEAEEFSPAALERDPGSGRALLGLAQAQQVLGKTEAAKNNWALFAKAWVRADADLPESLRAKQPTMKAEISSN